jgi:hypothetical protein
LFLPLPVRILPALKAGSQFFPASHILHGFPKYVNKKQGVKLTPRG